MLLWSPRVLGLMNGSSFGYSRQVHILIERVVLEVVAHTEIERQAGRGPPRILDVGLEQIRLEVLRDRRQRGRELGRLLEARDRRRVVRIEQLIGAERPGPERIPRQVLLVWGANRRHAHLPAMVAALVRDEREIIVELPPGFDLHLVGGGSPGQARELVHGRQVRIPIGREIADLGPDAATESDGPFRYANGAHWKRNSFSVLFDNTESCPITSELRRCCTLAPAVDSRGCRRSSGIPGRRAPSPTGQRMSGAA